MDAQQQQQLRLDQSAPSSAADEKPETKATEVKRKKELAPVRAMFRFASWFDVLLILGGTICAVANGASTAAFAIILGDIFDALNSPDSGRASQLSLLFVWVGIGLFFAAGLQVALLTAASERMTIRLRQAYFKSILSQDISFFDAQNGGALTSRIAENSIFFREAMGEKLGSLFQFGSMFVAGIIVGFTYLWQLCLVILALTPLLGLSGYFMVKTVSDIVSGQLESYAAAGAIAEESISMIRTVTAFNLQKSKVDKYSEEVARAARKSTRQGIAVGIGFGAVMFFYYCSYSIAFWTGTVLIANSKSDAAAKYPPLNPPSVNTSFCAVGQPVPSICAAATEGPTVFETDADVCGCSLCQCGCFYAPPGGPPTTSSSCVTGGEVVLTFFAVLIGSVAIGQAAGPFQTFTNGRSAAASLFKVIDKKSAIDADSEDGLKLGNVRGEIRFENVAFSYPTRKDAHVFKSLNLKIAAGKRVALVGESGSGKSTCIGLLERYYDPDAGRVTLDGHDLRTLNVRHLRTLMGLVSQEPILFGTSILENVRFGRPGATDEEIYQACRDANADDFIQSFPDKYNTFVTSSLVSGGQKQRIAIARALLKNPAILLLDEATAALDNESERLVNEAIEKLLHGSASGGRTTIVIAHRLSSIRACDTIYVLEKGQVVEEGSHDDLIERNGLYASLNKLSEGGRLGAALAKQKKEVVSPKDPASKSLAGAGSEDDKTLSSEPSTRAENTQATVSIEPSAGTSDQADAASTKKYSVWKAFRYASNEKLLFIPAMIGAAGNGASLPVFALLFAQVVDIYYYTNTSTLKEKTAIWCLAFFGLAIGAAICIFMQNFFFGIISGRMTMRVRSETFKHVMSLEVGFFDDKKNSVGAVSAKLASDAALLRAAICDRLAAIAMNISTLVAGYVIAMLGSWKVSLVVTALFPAIIFAGLMEFQVMAGIAGTDQRALEGAAHTMSEAVMGIRTVAAFNMQEPVRKLYLQQLLGPLKKAQTKGFSAGAGYGFSQAVQFFCFALTLWYGSRLVTSGEITFRDLNQAMFGIFMCAFSLGQNAALTPDLAKGQAAVQSIFTLLDRKSLINPFDESGLKPSVVLGDIEFENINFSYPTRPDLVVLDRFNLKVQRGQTVAFVGTSGSGKSTLVLLLERFYDPGAGTVKLDGVNVRDLNIEWLRSQMGIVSQEPALFRGTIKENIRAGKPDATDDDIFAAAKMANAHDFISAFPSGYDTNLENQNFGVSGGQKQRISLARALIRNPKILLLDEATSALDEESQRVVQEALDSLMEHNKRTTIVVAHRLSTIRNADVIVVLQNGIVVEQGSFDDLVAKKGGAFESLLRAQGKIDSH